MDKFSLSKAFQCDPKKEERTKKKELHIAMVLNILVL